MFVPGPVSWASLGPGSLQEPPRAPVDRTAPTKASARGWRRHGTWGNYAAGPLPAQAGSKNIQCTLAGAPPHFKPRHFNVNGIQSVQGSTYPEGFFREKLPAKATPASRAPNAASATFTGSGTAVMSSRKAVQRGRVARTQVRKKERPIPVRIGGVKRGQIRICRIVARKIRAARRRNGTAGPLNKCYVHGRTTQPCARAVEQGGNLASVRQIRVNVPVIPSA